MYKASLFIAAMVLAAILFAVLAPQTSAAPASTPDTFSFVSMGDGQAAAANFTRTVNQAAGLNPDLVIFNGDLENNGVVSTEINPMITAIKNAGLFNQTFLVRGNHDNHVSGSATLWEKYFETSPNLKVLPAGFTDYVSLDASSDYLNYSFIYGNAMFIGLDVPGDASLLTSAELAFLDTRLTFAESIGLVHAFISFHGPLYCVESVHCNCSAKTNSSCTPPALVSVLNRHPIVSATFHGHEHILGWTHMDKTRVAGLTGSFEQFLTSPAGGGTYNAYLYPARVNYAYLNMSGSQGLAAINVNGCSFTFSLYKVGTTTAVWSRTFIKTICPTPTATFTETPTETMTATSSAANTDTPTSTETPAWTETQTETASFTPTETLTFTPSETATATHTPTPTNSVTPASTPTPSLPTFTPGHTATPAHTLNTLYLPFVLNRARP